jgi:hypothetical protein
MKLILNRCLFVAAAFGTSALSLGLAGCENASSTVGVKAVPAAENLPLYTSARTANVEFEKPYRLKSSDGSFIAVESPGYACPTLADIDGDGDDDLVVGQFTGGNMQLYRNEAGSGALPKFGYLEWISSDGQRAEVPGVS